MAKLRAPSCCDDEAATVRRDALLERVSSCLDEDATMLDDMVAMVRMRREELWGNDGKEASLVFGISIQPHRHGTARSGRATLGGVRLT